MSVFPNALFIGAPKCGTSSAFNWLIAHPDCGGSNPKETFYLMDEGHPLISRPSFHEAGPGGYSTLFEPIADRKVRVEATTHYLYQKTPLEFLRQLSPQPKIVVMIRRPEYRILSSFLYTRNNLARLDSSVTFREFTDCLLAGTVDSLRPRFTEEESFYVLKRDLEYSRYLGFLEPWAEAFGRENVKIVTFYHFIRNPRETMEGIARHVGLDPDFYEDMDFLKHNETRSMSMQVLHRLALSIRHLLPRTIVKSDGIRAAYFGLQEWLGRRKTPEDYSTPLRALNSYFVPYNEALSKTFDLDLSIWHHSVAV